MSLLSPFVTDVPGQVGNRPRRIPMIVTDSLATITTAGYLNPLIKNEAQSILASDIFDIWYGATNAANPGTYGRFTVTIVNGIITLIPWTGASAKATGTEASNAVTVNATSGVITTSSLTTAGGSSYAITWTNQFISSSSVVLLTLMGGTNTTKNITLQATAGAGSSTLTIYNNTASTALNGTVLIGFQLL